MNDAVIEVLVDQKVPVGKKVLQIVLIAMTVVLVLGSLFGGIFALLFAVVTGVAAYFVGMRTKIEYEYIYFNKELDIDVIYSMQKRKRVVTYDLTQLEMLAPANSYHLDDFRNRNYKVRDFSSLKEENNSNVYVMYIAGTDKVIFEPTPQMFKTIGNFSPRKVFTE